MPKSEPQRQAYVHAVGLDGYALLDAIDAEGTPAWLRDLPAVKALWYIWMQQYYWMRQYSRSPEGIRWRTAVDGLPPSTRMISSPHDLEARYAKKYTTSWIGYKVHFTESREADEPHLITHVETTAGSIADGTVTPIIHEALRAKQLLPRLHIVDTGYLDADLLVTTPRDYAVELLHRERQAYVYVRQSTPKQVQHHQERQRNRYALVPRALDLGWPASQVHVIDADLGQSGQDGQRPGFQELVAAVSLGRVGIVLAYEASRLARNNAAWYTLLDLAAVVGTLMADTEGVLRPTPVQ